MVKIATYSGINVITYENKVPMQKHVYEVIAILKIMHVFLLKSNWTANGPH